MTVVLMLGSAVMALRARAWPKQAFDRVLAINNAWRLRPDWDAMIHPWDFPADRVPQPGAGQRVVTEADFVPAQNAYGGFVYGGGTMAFTAAYWALHALRPRMIAAFGCLLLAKLASVYVPIVFKNMIDDLSGGQDVLLVLPVGLLLLYGFSRLASTGFTELREILFVRVTQQAIRRIALSVFTHLHNLSLRFHLERQTGGVSRDIDRGTRAISNLISYTLYSILPTIIELLLVMGVLAGFCAMANDSSAYARAPSASASSRTCAPRASTASTTPSSTRTSWASATARSPRSSAASRDRKSVV